MKTRRGLPAPPPARRRTRRAPEPEPAPAPGPTPGDALLQRVGQAVRRCRAARGLSQRALAAASGVSARFLAQLETGTGNISLRRLDDLARALDLSVLQILSTAPPAAGPRLALVGLRGAGKSTIGRRLARRLGLPFIELDQLIEEAAGLPMAQIFELHGDRYFRALERQTLSAFLESGRAAVLAVGGGLVTEPETYALLRQSTFTIWLSARPEDHFERVQAQGDRRPMADHPHAMGELRALLASRESLYRQADLIVDTSRQPVPATVDALVKTARNRD